MRFGTDDHIHARRIGQSRLFDVHSHFAQNRVTCSSEAGEVRHLASGDESDARLARQVENLQHPLRRDFFDHRRNRRRRVDAGILIPRAREPIRRERDGQRAADHESEVARPGAGDRAAFSLRCEIVDDDR